MPSAVLPTLIDRMPKYEPTSSPSDSSHAQVVEERVVRRPQVRPVHLELQRLVRVPADPPDRAAVVVGDGFDALLHRPADHGVHRDRPARDVRRDVEPVDVRRGHRLHPHGLPDAGGRRVEDAVAGLALLADRLPALVVRVGDADDELLGLRGGQRVGDVDGERVVAAGVAADGLAVDDDRGVVVDGLEVQLQPLSLADLPVLGHLERAAVPHVRLVAHDPGQRGLDRVRHEDALAERLPDRRGLTRGRLGELPDAVEVLPLVAGQLRPRVVGEGVRRRDVLRPRRGQRGSQPLPLWCGRGARRGGGAEAGDRDGERRGGGQPSPGFSGRAEHR